MRVAIRSQGCKVNLCDELELAAALAARGLEVVPWEAEADVYVVNTCTVTATADRGNRQLVYQAHRRAPEAAIVVTGCSAQVAPEEAAALPGVVCVVPTGARAGLADAVAALVPRASVLASAPSAPRAARARPYVKVADGCDSRCAYCIVPRARGPARSVPAGRVLERLHSLAQAGAAEAVLTAVDLGAWGRDLSPAMDLAALLARIELEAPVPRLRLSSLEPMGITDALLDVLAGSRVLCRHLHVPLQSGDDGVLVAMGRPYDRRAFSALCRRLLDRLPGLCLGTDVICGFPGESEAAYANTVELCADIGFSYLHAFPFSPRPGTPAAALPDDVPHAEKKRRVRELRARSRLARARFAAQRVGSVVEVVVERECADAPGTFSGLTRGYVTARFAGPAHPGHLARVLVERAAGGTLHGRALEAA